MMIPEEGEVLKYLPTGNIFEIEKITNQFVILHSMDGLTQIMTGKKSLVNLFEKIPQLNSRGPSLAEFM
jgi:hypothetical protein